MVERADAWQETREARALVTSRLQEVAEWLAGYYNLADRVWECADERREVLLELAREHGEDSEVDFLYDALSDLANPAQD
jgi:hypothetical protein